MFKLVIPAFAALSLAAAAHAKDPEMTVVSVTVPYADLDLTSEAGAATLHERIVAAASHVCRRPDARSFDAGPSWQACRKKAVDEAMLQVAALRTPLVASAR